MTAPEPHRHDEEAQGTVHSGHHGWMMMVCCIPMVVAAVALVATGVVGVGFLFAAVGCTAMMFLMMRAMSGGESDRS